METQETAITDTMDVKKRPAWVKPLADVVALIVNCYKPEAGRINTVAFDAGPYQDAAQFEVCVQSADAWCITLQIQSSIFRGQKEEMEAMVQEELKELERRGTIAEVMAAWCGQKDTIEVELVLPRT